MADQVVLKHLREGTAGVPVEQMEVELRMSPPPAAAAFARLEAALAGCEAWQQVTDAATTDVTVGDVRVTDGRTAIRKRRVATTDLPGYRVCTCQEEPAAAVLTADGGHRRTKRRRERHFSGWKVMLTEVNAGTENPGFEVEVELDNLWLVRQPMEVLAKTGAGLMDDLLRLTAPA